MDWIPSYADVEHHLAALQLALAMLAMGALLTPGDFVAVANRPKGLIAGLGTQLVLVPLLASLLARVLPLTPGMVAGVILVSAIPGGTFSNLLTWIGRGNVALSIALTAITTVAALVTTPALLSLLAGAHLPDDFEMPVARVAREIAVSLLIPLLLGMAAGGLLPARREAISRWALRACFVVIGMLVVGAAGAGRIDPRSFGLSASVALVLLAVLFSVGAWGVSRACGLPSHERVALMIEATLRNGNLGILVKASLFPAVAGQIDPIGDAMLFSVMFYGAIGLVAALPSAFWHRHRGEPWQGRAALARQPSGSTAR